MQGPNSPGPTERVARQRIARKRDEQCDAHRAAIGVRIRNGAVTHRRRVIAVVTRLVDPRAQDMFLEYLLARLFGAAVKGNEERKDRERLESVKSYPCPECRRINPATCRVCPRCTYKLYKDWNAQADSCTGNPYTEPMGGSENRGSQNSG